MDVVMAEYRDGANIDNALALIRQYAIQYGLTGGNVQEIFRAGIGAASFVKPEILGTATGVIPADG